jgi:alpha-glucan,water dikinase
MDFSLYVNEITALLKNILITYNNYPEIKICLEDWICFAEGLKEEVKKGNQDAAMKVKSVYDRISRLLGHVIDFYNTEFSPRAILFGNGCKIDKYYVNLFTEEEIRGSIFFALSMILNKIEPILREKANLGNWLILSQVEKEITTGKLRFGKNLEKVQLLKFEEKHF